MRRSVGPARKKQPRKPIPRRNPKRAAKKFIRNFHSKEYVEWIRGKPCAYCGRVGWSVAAHVVPRGMGGANGKASDLVPLCDPFAGLGTWRWPLDLWGCHWLYDNHELPPETKDELAAKAAELWASFQEESA